MPETSTPGRTVGTNEDRFFALSLDLLAEVGFDGYLKRVNPAWERLLGWTPEELTARPYAELIHPADRQRTLAEAARLVEPGVESRDFELRFASKDGSWKWLLFSAQGSAEEQVIYVVGKDITERKVAEDALREAEERFRKAFESAPIGMALTGTDGRFMWVNRRLSEITGRSEAELTGTSMLDITHVADRGATTQRCAR